MLFSYVSLMKYYFVWVKCLESTWISMAHYCNEYVSSCKIHQCWSVLTQKCVCSLKKIHQVCCHGHTQFFQQAEPEWRACDQSTQSDEGCVDVLWLCQLSPRIWFDSSNPSAVEFSSVAELLLPGSEEQFCSSLTAIHPMI